MKKHYKALKRLLSLVFVFVVISLLVTSFVMSASHTNAQDPVMPQLTADEVLALTTFDYTITQVEMVSATDEVPEHLLVNGFILPEIRFALGLPTEWNGRFYMAGNGGYAGTISPLNGGLSQGYATVSTDTGHNAAIEPLGTFAYNNPAAEIDYSYRAVHLTAVTAKEIIEQYYGQAPEYNYWVGCSTGGRQGLMSAQRFPADFDGIVAGAPVLDFTGTQIWGIWNALALSEAPILPEQLPLLAQSVYENCDADDGLEDGLITEPRNCNFDPLTDLPICSGEPGSDCFTEEQTEALAKIYNGVTTSDGEVIFPGQSLGAEVVGVGFAGPASGWDRWIIGEPSLQFLFGETFMKYLAFEVDDPEWDWTTFNVDEDVLRMDYIRSILDSNDPDMSDFEARGGKIIQYHGWADTALTPFMSIEYYESVLEEMGEGTTDFYRLYMVPGMFHCSGGVGAFQVDWFSPLVDWVENGVVPESLIGSNVSETGEVNFTRPHCPYPQVAVYDGSGDPDDAASFTCGVPE